MTVALEVERLVDTLEAAAALEVPPDYIYQLKARGKIIPADSIQGRGRGGRTPLYRLAELEPHAEAWHARQAARRAREAAARARRTP